MRYGTDAEVQCNTCGGTSRIPAGQALRCLKCDPPPTPDPTAEAERLGRIAHDAVFDVADASVWITDESLDRDDWPRVATAVAAEVRATDAARVRELVEAARDLTTTDSPARYVQAFDRLRAALAAFD